MQPSVSYIDLQFQLENIAKDIVEENIKRILWNDCNPYAKENNGLDKLFSILNEKTYQLLAGS